MKVSRFQALLQFVHGKFAEPDLPRLFASIRAGGREAQHAVGFVLSLFATVCAERAVLD